MSTVVWTTLIVSQQSICEFQEPKVRKISPIDFQQYYKGGNTGNRITSEAHRRNFGIGCRNEMGWRWPALYVYKQCSACQLPIVRLAACHEEVLFWEIRTMFGLPECCITPRYIYYRCISKCVFAALSREADHGGHIVGIQRRFLPFSQVAVDLIWSDYYKYVHIYVYVYIYTTVFFDGSTWQTSLELQ